MENSNKLYISQVNADSIISKMNSIKCLLKEKQHLNFILLVNDTRLMKKQIIKFDGYKLMRVDSSGNNRRAGGSCIIYKRDLYIKRVDCSNDEQLIVDVVFNSKVIRLSTVYCRPRMIFKEEYFNAIIRNGANVNIEVLMGDFNGHVGLDSHRKNNSGRKILEFSEKNRFDILNSSDATYMSYAKGTTSCIDLCLYKEKAAAGGVRKTWSVGGDVGSDHWVTNLVIETGSQAGSRKLRKVDWAGVRKKSEGMVIKEDYGSLEGIEATTEELTRSLGEILESSTKEKRHLTREGFTLSPTTTALIRLRRRYRKKIIAKKEAGEDVEDLRKAMNVIRKQMVKAIKEDMARRDYLESSNLVDQRNSREFWNKLRRLAPELGKEKQRVQCGLLTSTGVITNDEEEMAQIHAERLGEAHSFPTGLDFDDIFMKEVEKEVEALEPSLQPNIDDVTILPDDQLQEERRVGRNGKVAPPEFFDNKVTAEEIKYHLAGKSSKSAPGQDGVSYKMLKNCSYSIFLLLARLFTCILTSGYYPKSWKSVLVTMIPKPQKNHTKSEGYRPISLSSCLGKLFECCLKVRVLKKLPDDNIFQTAYKNGRSADEHLLRLSEEVFTCFNRRECVLAVFLDVKGAFDRVWIRGLIFKLIKLGLPLRLLKLTTGFLNCRKLRVKVGSKFSRYVRMRGGTPQGAVISPILFNYFVDDLRKSLGTEVHLCQFADDIALFIRIKCPRLAEYKMQVELDKVYAWCNKWRIALAPDKSNCVLFSRCPTLRKMHINLNLGGTRIERSNCVRFLGLHFDEKLNWKSHVNKLIQRTICRRNALFSLSKKQKFKNVDFIYKLHDVFVNSVFRYGCTSLISMNNATWEVITRYHNNCVRLYAGMPKFISRKFLLDFCQITCFKESLTSTAKKRYFNLRAFSPFGNGFADSHLRNMNGTYKSPCNVLST